MKFKTTAKAIREEYGKKIKIGYCGAQHLLNYESPVAYTCGTYGWNFDVYNFDGVIICTGYRGMVGKSVDYDTLSEYETAAEKIVHDNTIPFEEQRERVRSLLREFISKVV